MSTRANLSNNDRRRDRQTEMAALIVEAVAEEVDRGMPADSTLARVYRQHPEFGSRDRRLYTHTVYAYFRWLGWTRLIASDDTRAMCAWSVVIDPTSTEEIRDMWLSRIPITPDQATSLHSAALPEVGNIAATLSSPGQDVGALPSLTLRQLMPAWVATLWSDPAALNDFIVSCQSRPPTWLRIPAGDIPVFRQMLETQRVDFSMHERVRGAFAITSPFQLVELERSFGKTIQVQDLASQAVVLACHARPGESWWDACSGSGGKTLFLAENVGPSGHVLATDTRESILQNLIRRASSHHISHIETAVIDVAEHGPGDRMFDGVLVDAPCSGIGTWPRNPDARWRTMADTVRQKAGLQMSILSMASQSVKPGGVLVYAVCSVATCEGPDVIRSFLDKHADFSREEFPHPLTGNATSGELLISPSDGPCDGMYMARLRRS